MLSSVRLCAAAVCCLALCFGSDGAAAQSSEDAPPAIRVRLMDDTEADRTRLRAEGGPLQLIDGENGLPLTTLDAGEDVLLGTRDREVYLRGEDGGLYARSLRIAPTQGAQWSLASATEGFRPYIGDLRVAPDSANPERLQLINAVPLEDYVASVVASEYTMDDIEGAKAMAVVARTYALRATDKFGRAYDHVDHVLSQVYKGTATITPEARAAAESTRGEVLTYDGSLIEATYFSASGGHTANNEDVWDADEVLPYLRGKPDPYTDQSPHRRWRVTVPRSELLDHLSNRFDRTIEGFLIDERSADGRVHTIELLTATGDPLPMQANAFRLFINEHFPSVNLKSTWFDARRSGNQYVFDGRGYGHGVGLSQWGAHEMAARGYSYREILTFYYTDVQIEPLDYADVPSQPPLARQSPPPDTTETNRRIGW